MSRARPLLSASSGTSSPSPAPSQHHSFHAGSLLPSFKSSSSVASTSTMTPMEPWSIVPIQYNIAGASEHSGRYAPENIKVDRPRDQSSRWSGASSGVASGSNGGGRQWILLELKNVSILETITFGKFYKTHPCNVKEFKLLVGISPDHMTEVLHANLRNDERPETFRVPHTSQHGVPFPTKFVKILPISAHGANFHTSIWHVALAGVVDERIVQQVAAKYDEHRETIAMRHILKYLRQRRHITTYHYLLKRTGISFECPLVGELYTALVLHGDFARTEDLLHQIADAGLFSEYINSCAPRARWTRLRGVDADGDAHAPSARGGHAMCMDAARGVIYLFGGWDGRQSLDDFWTYDIHEGRWTEVCRSVGEEKNGPGPRSCHKMVFDPKTGCIYMLGRLSDGDYPSGGGASSGMGNNQASAGASAGQGGSDEGSATEREGGESSGGAARTRRSAGVGMSSGSARQPTHGYCSEFYRYRTRGLDRGKWELLSFDTATSGGPPLVYDHQLVIDSDAQVLYVQGGRVFDGDWENIKYSGLYSYEIRTSKWNLIIPSVSSERVIPARFGHSMLFEPLQRKLFVFMGQHDAGYLADMWEYDLSSGTLSQRCSDFTHAGGPDPSFSQRAVLDPGLKEMYVFAGLTRPRGNDAAAATSSNVWMYRYGSRPESWTNILPALPAASKPASGSGPSTTFLYFSASTKRPRNADSIPSAPANPGGNPASGSMAMNWGGASAEPSAAMDIDETEPVARCAHQVVYDQFTQTFYLHGGNGGLLSGPSGEESRLDDFWSMKLVRPTPDDVIRKAQFQTRRQQFREMCEETDPVKALSFLQNDVFRVVDHSNLDEAATFRSLLSHLLARPPQPPKGPSDSATETPSSGDSTESSVSSTPSIAPSDSEAPWTNDLHEGTPGDDDTIMLDASLSTFPSTPASRRAAAEHGDSHAGATLQEGEILARLAMDAPASMGDDDPYELALRAGRPLAQARFKQRTEVFEALLAYIATEAKQPSGNLLDLVCSGEM